MINYKYLNWCLKNMERGVYSPLTIEKILAKTHHLWTNGNLTLAQYRDLILRCEALEITKGDD